MSSADFFQFFGKEVLGPTLVGVAIAVSIWIRDWIKRKGNVPSIRVTAEKIDKIQTLLLEIRIRFDAARAYLALYHNGDKYVEGSSLLKMSRISETVAPGVSLEAENYRNILISLLNEENKLVCEKGPSFTITSTLSDGKFKRMCESRGIYAVARCGIRKGEDIIGFIGLDYNDQDMATPPESLNDLSRYAGIIEQVLSDYRGK